jgi:hypothetical protein
VFRERFFYAWSVLKCFEKLWMKRMYSWSSFSVFYYIFRVSTYLSFLTVGNYHLCVSSKTYFRHLNLLIYNNKISFQFFFWFLAGNLDQKNLDMAFLIFLSIQFQSFNNWKIRYYGNFIFGALHSGKSEGSHFCREKKSIKNPIISSAASGEILLTSKNWIAIFFVTIFH